MSVDTSPAQIAGAVPSSSRFRAGDTLRRHPASAVFLVALICRVLAAVVINHSFHGSLFQDDSTYSLLAAQRAAGQAGHWDTYTHALYKTTWTFSGPLTLLYRLFGPSQLLGQLFTALLGAATAGLATRTASEVIRTRFAVAAGVVVALLPSQVLFSSIILKDAAVWIVLTALALTIAVLGRTTGRRVLPLLCCLTGLLYLLGHLRVHTLVAACWAAGLAALFGVAPWRRRRAGAVALVAVVVPWLMALGPAGLGLVYGAQGSLEARREANAVGASTAVVATPSAATPAAIADPGAATAANLRYLPRGVDVILLEPLRPSANRRLQLAFAENLLWWPLLILAGVGIVTARRKLRVLAFPMLAAGGLTVVYGLSEGNLGTAFRHRGEIVGAVAILAAWGAQSLAAWRLTTSDD